MDEPSYAMGRLGSKIALFPLLFPVFRDRDFRSAHPQPSMSMSSVRFPDSTLTSRTVPTPGA